MDLKNKKTKRKKLPIVLVVVGVLLLTGSVAAFVLKDKIKLVAADATESIENRGKPKFIFDDAKLSDWWTAGNTWLNPNDADGNTPENSKWPISDISIHQCKTSSQCKSPEKDIAGANCFVMTFYQEGVIDPGVAIADTIKQNKGFGMTIQEVGVKTLTMNTPEGDKEYKLYQYDYENKGGESVMQGNAQGYISMSDGYIDVRGICAEASQLDEILPVLNAIHLAI